MQPRSPFVQPFDALPEQLPIYAIENALLPCGELPLELSEPAELELIFSALKSDQLIGMVQPQPDTGNFGIYQTGCAGRIRQYRERKDGHIDVMLTGICRYRILETQQHENGYLISKVDWSDFPQDYENETVGTEIIARFKKVLRNYFYREHIPADWDVLDKLPIEQVVNNLVLLLKLDIGSKQQLLESPTVTTRLELFSSLIDSNVVPLHA